MNTGNTKEYFTEAFVELEKVAYSHSNQGVRVREFLLSFHNNRKVDIFGLINLDSKLQRHVLYLIESHINSPHCVAYAFRNKLDELSRFEDL